MKLILASKSRSRSEMLRNAGLEIECMPSDLDEDIIKNKGLSVQETALELAYAKAEVISKDKKDAFVIGADQMLSFGTELLDKAKDFNEVKEQLKKMSGKSHTLYSAVSVVQNGQELWSHCETADLNMRDFTSTFIDQYIREKGEELLETVGCYRLESKGVQLFSKIEGDYFTILGLPLLALLEFLRSKQVIES